MKMNGNSYENKYCVRKNATCSHRRCTIWMEATYRQSKSPENRLRSVHLCFFVDVKHVPFGFKNFQNRILCTKIGFVSFLHLPQTSHEALGAARRLSNLRVHSHTRIIQQWRSSWSDCSYHSHPAVHVARRRLYEQTNLSQNGVRNKRLKAVTIGFTRPPMNLPLPNKSATVGECQSMRKVG